MGDHHLSLLFFFFLFLPDLFILPRYVHLHFYRISNHVPTRGAAFSILSLAFSLLLLFSSFLLFILWVWRFSVTHHYPKPQRESHGHFSGVDFFVILTFIHLLSALSGHLPTHDALPVSRMEDVGFGRPFCRISFYCSSSIPKHLFFFFFFFCYWM